MPTTMFETLCKAFAGNRQRDQKLDENCRRLAIAFRRGLIQLGWPAANLNWIPWAGDVPDHPEAHELREVLVTLQDEGCQGVRLMAGGEVEEGSFNVYPQLRLRCCAIDPGVARGREGVHRWRERPRDDRQGRGGVLHRPHQDDVRGGAREMAAGGAAEGHAEGARFRTRPDEPLGLGTTMPVRCPRSFAFCRSSPAEQNFSDVAALSGTARKSDRPCLLSRREDRVASSPARWPWPRGPRRGSGGSGSARWKTCCRASCPGR